MKFEIQYDNIKSQIDNTDEIILRYLYDQEKSNTYNRQMYFMSYEEWCLKMLKNAIEAKRFGLEDLT